MQLCSLMLPLVPWTVPSTGEDAKHMANVKLANSDWLYLHCNTDINSLWFVKMHNALLFDVVCRPVLGPKGHKIIIIQAAGKNSWRS